MDGTHDAHAVIVSLHMAAMPDADRASLFALADRLEWAVRSAGAGEFDGHEFGPSDVAYYMYGPDADRLFAAVEPVLRQLAPPEGSYVTKRYGPPGAQEDRMSLPLR